MKYLSNQDWTTQFVFLFSYVQIFFIPPIRGCAAWKLAMQTDIHVCVCVWEGVWVRPNKPLSGSQPTLHVLSQHTCTSLNLKLRPNELVRRSHCDASISVTDTWEETESSQYVFSYDALEWMPKKKKRKKEAYLLFSNERRRPCR